jgi:predicted  nucleic acid-binding Zn-ribbon protein
MNDITWVAVVGVLLLISQLLNLFNSANTAKKNANAPLDTVKEDVKQNRTDIVKLQAEMTTAKKDIDHAHAKIRETETKLEQTTKAQNKAFMALLFWAKSGGQDSSRIDDAINEISEL